MRTTDTTSEAEILTFLRSRGFGGGHKDPLGGGGMMYQRRYDNYPRPCLSNDHLYLNITLWDLLDRDGTVRRSAEYEICGQYDEESEEDYNSRWAKLKVYNLTWARAMADLDVISNGLLRAWEALYLMHTDPSLVVVPAPDPSPEPEDDRVVASYADLFR